MAYKCFKDNYITVRGCSNVAPTSGLFLDDKPGINLQLLADVVEGDIVSGEELVKRLQDESVQLVGQDYLGYLMQDLNFGGVIGSEKYGDIGDEMAAPDKRYVGFELDRNDVDAFTKIMVGYFNFKPDVSQSVAVRVQDGLGSTPVDTTITTVAYQENKVHLNHVASEETVRVWIDTNGMNLATTNSFLTHSRVADCSSCHASAGGCIRILGIQSDDETTWEYTTQAGIVIRAECQCDEWELVCISQDVLKFAIRDKMAILFWQYVLNSDRANIGARKAKEDAERELQRLEPRVSSALTSERAGSYDRALKLAVKRGRQMVSNINTACIGCGDTIKVISTLP